jgi:hypothetical protein
MPFRLVEENTKQPLQRESISLLWYIKESTIIFLTNRNRIEQHNIKNHQSNEHQTISTMPLSGSKRTRINLTALADQENRNHPIANQQPTLNRTASKINLHCRGISTNIIKIEL